VNTRPFLISFVVSFALIILGSFAGRALEAGSKGITKPPDPKRALKVKLFFLCLFWVMAFSLVPVALHLFTAMQMRIGNGDVPAVRWLIAHEPSVVYWVWALFTAGTVFGISAAVKGGLFKQQG